jgi:hypothetical protein
MRILFTILFTFILGAAYAQEPVYNQMRSNYQFKGVRVDSLLLFPKFNDTTAANNTALDSIAGNVIRVGNTVYYRSTDLKKWMTFGGGSSIDTTSLSNRINAKADSSIGLNKVLQNGNTAYNYIDLLDSINGKYYEIYIDPSSGDNALFGMVDTSYNYLVLQTNGPYSNPSIYFENKGMPQYLIQQDSTTGILFLPTQNGGIDTLATLRYVRDSASGGNLTLNQVTDFGNTTQNAIQFVDDANLLMDTFSSVLFANNSRIKEGTIDAEYGGNKGVALICGLGYEYKWEGGMLFVMNGNGNAIREAKYMFTYVPQDTNDVSEGYYVGSRWILDNGDTYVCTDNTINAAVWDLQPNAFDSTSLSNRINDKIDSLKKENDTVYFKKDGIWFTSFKDSVGSGNGRWGNDTAMVILAKVHNDAGSTLLKGEIVYLSGANGDVASVKRANNKYDSTSATTIGMVKDNIANNDTGWVVTQGQISKINTSAFNPGDIVYLDSIDGKFTKTKQYAPYHLVFIGVVERANAGNGQLYIKPQNGYELNELHDVSINNKINNQILVYSDTQDLWKNRNIYSIVDTTSLSNRINTKQDILLGYDETNDRLGLKQASPTASLHINSNKNTATQSDTAGILLANSTAAIAGTQSVSPPIVWQGNGWKTTATAASQDVRFRAYALPVQGTTNPTGQWIVESNINNAGYSQLFSLTSGSGASIGPVNYSPGKINISSYNIKTAAPTENVMTLSSTEVGPSTFPTQLNFLQKGATVGWTIQSVNQGVGYTPLILNELGGNVLIGTTTNQGARLNVNGTIRGSQFILSALNTAPATATSTGTTGEIRIVNGFIYVCVATNTWQRAAISTW